MPDRLGHALTFASELSATYKESRSAKPGARQAKAAMCPLCRRYAVLVNDHCHRSGYNRDRICNLCNIGLGLFRDDVHALERAIAYLLRHRADHAERSKGPRASAVAVNAHAG